MSFQSEIIEQLRQLKTATWDGDLISKYLRDRCIENGLANRSKCGWNVITSEGLSVLVEQDGLWPRSPTPPLMEIVDKLIQEYESVQEKTTDFKEGAIYSFFINDLKEIKAALQPTDDHAGILELKDEILKSFKP